MSIQLKQIGQGGATNGQVVRWNAALGIFVAESVARQIDIPLSGTSSSSVATKEASYVVVAKFIFRGTTVMGVPTAITSISSADSGATTGIRIFDVTNSLVIATNETITSATSAINDLGALTNLPTGPAIFEVQLRRAAGTGPDTAIASAIQIQF